MSVYTLYQKVSVYTLYHNISVSIYIRSHSKCQYICYNTEKAICALYLQELSKSLKAEFQFLWMVC